MNTVLSPRDWQQLSEYLDDQLGPGIRTQVEKNLSTSAEWAAGLQSLEATRSVLRAAPQRRAPRNYTLTTIEAASYRQNRFNFPIYKFSSAFSAILTVLFLVLGFTSRGLLSQPMLAAAPMMEQAADSASEATSMPIIIWGSPEMNQYAYGAGGAPAGGMGGGGMGGGGGGADIMSAEAAPPVGKSMEDFASEPAMDTIVSSEEPVIAPAPVLESAPDIMALSPQATQLPAPTTVAAAPKENANPILGIQPREMSQPESEMQITEEAQPISPWWFAALGCLLITIFLGYLGWKPTKHHHE